MWLPLNQGQKHQKSNLFNSVLKMFVCFMRKYQSENQLRPASARWKVWGWGDGRQYRAFSGFTAALSIVSNIAQPPYPTCYWAGLQPRSCKIHVSSLSVHRSSGYTIHDTWEHSAAHIINLEWLWGWDKKQWRKLCWCSKSKQEMLLYLGWQM